MLKHMKIDRKLYLAVPKDAYQEFFLEPYGKEAVEEENLKIVVYDPIKENIILWINWSITDK